MSSKPNVEARRSTRVPLKVVIREWITESLICEGETIIVNLHGLSKTGDVRMDPGAVISSDTPFEGSMRGI